MTTAALLDELAEMTSAEDFLNYFFIAFDPVVVQVNRLADGRRIVSQVGVVRRGGSGAVTIELGADCIDGRTLRPGPAWEELAEVVGCDWDEVAS